MNSKARITSIGTHVPEKRLTNGDLEKIVETSDEWIVKRTGMRERRIASENEFTSDLCIEAVKNLMRTYKKTVDDVDFIIVSTTTPDYPFPSVACLVQDALGIRQAGAIDLNATCAGFVYGLHLANGLINTGVHKKVLVIGGETLSKVTDYKDRSTCVLFGDGAGAVLVEADESRPGFLSAYTDSQGEGSIHLYRSGLADQMKGRVLQGDGKMVQNGREVYKWAVQTVPAGIEKVLKQSGLGIDAIDWFVPHSANLRMIESICEKSGIPMEKTLTSVEYMGNTSSASIPLALKLGIEEGKVREGDKILLYGFGGGLVQAAILVEWGAGEPA